MNNNKNNNDLKILNIIFLRVILWYKFCGEFCRMSPQQHLLLFLDALILSTYLSWHDQKYLNLLLNQ